jgi:inorganic pyrophosphatase
MTIGIALISWLGLPYTFTIYNFGDQKTVQSWYEKNFDWPLKFLV